MRFHFILAGHYNFVPENNSAKRIMFHVSSCKILYWDGLIK